MRHLSLRDSECSWDEEGEVGRKVVLHACLIEELCRLNNPFRRRMTSLSTVRDRDLFALSWVFAHHIMLIRSFEGSRRASESEADY